VRLVQERACLAAVLQREAAGVEFGSEYAEKQNVGTDVRLRDLKFHW
jgi:hypothetical protein